MSIQHRVRTLRRGLPLAAALVTAGLLFGACRTETPPVPPGDGPRLVLLVVIDQMRADYLDRFDGLFEGGLRRLVDSGVRFDRAFHAHGYTVTGVGHATLATGSLPRAHGIVGNAWRGRPDGEWIYSVGDERHGRSPVNLLRAGIGDWIKGVHPASKAFAVGGKDRASILLGGQNPDGAFWYDRETGEITSSSYYPDPDPDWMVELNEERLLDAYYGQPWELLPVVAQAGEELQIVAPDHGIFPPSLPHTFGGAGLGPDEDFYEALYGSPFLDELTVAAAKRLVAAEDLGSDGAIDYLGVAFSALDTVGHDYGPNGPETLDTLLRLDRYLGDLLDFLDAEIGLQHVVVGLSSDHGVMMVPEVLNTLGGSGRRMDSEVTLCFQRAGLALAERFGDEVWFQDNYINQAAVAERGVDPEELMDEARRLLHGCPAVARVWVRGDLQSVIASSDPIQLLYGNGYHAERSPDLIVQFEPNFMPSRSVATNHGSPYPYDTHVPWLVLAEGLSAGRVAERVHTVDVAPTLATFAGLPVPEGLAGRDRSAMARNAQPPVVDAGEEAAEATP